MTSNRWINRASALTKVGGRIVCTGGGRRQLLLSVAYCCAVLSMNLSSAIGQQASDAGLQIYTTRNSEISLQSVDNQANFNFIVFGDRTSGVPAGLKVLEQAVRDTNLLAPDLVMTVGDLIQGYNEENEWLAQMAEYKAVMSHLKMSWFPVAGNHDIYWRGKGEAPVGHHESNYEKHFGPLWYSFRHKTAGFIVLFSDEGDVEKNEKGFKEARLQNMSSEQLKFLKGALDKLSDAEHVFVFMHHPRWIGGGYAGSNWDVVHNLFKDAGNVSAVFAGHIHSMRGDGLRDGIRYQTLATTGGNLSGNVPEAGLLHHINMVRVRGKDFSIASLPVGAVIDPNKYTQKHLAAVNAVRNIKGGEMKNNLRLEPNKSASGNVEYKFQNDSPFTVTVEATIDSSNVDWEVKPMKRVFDLAPKATGRMSFELSRDPSSQLDISVPHLVLQKSYVPDGYDAPVILPEERSPLALELSTVPVDFFKDVVNKCLLVTNPRHAVRIDSEDLKLPDGPFTVEAWLYPYDLSGMKAPIAKTQGSEFAIFLNEGVPQFDVHLAGKYVSAKAKSPIALNKWTHVAGVFDGTHVALYVNGEMAGRVPGRGKRTLNKLPLYIGADPDDKGAPSRPMIGKVDEARITADAVYSEAFQPQRRLLPAAKTVLMLNLDRGFGPFVLDRSESGIHATLDSDAKLEAVLVP